MFFLQMIVGVLCHAGVAIYNWKKNYNWKKVKTKKGLCTD